MNQTPTFTTDQGPSANNQTSNDHGHDSNQAARQPTTREVLEDEGLLTESSDSPTDLTSANID